MDNGACQRRPGCQLSHHITADATCGLDRDTEWRVLCSSRVLCMLPTHTNLERAVCAMLSASLNGCVVRVNMNASRNATCFNILLLWVGPKTQTPHHTTHTLHVFCTHTVFFPIPSPDHITNKLCHTSCTTFQYSWETLAVFKHHFHA